ncbi:membrane protein [Candidatus Thiomargarita nelsonii]|uniref:Membrane protein n=1 Tax=Candidatus Thiomargarita nelsonii TaxID=1003181 RepID=A0A176RZX7_9GAMM|nr:membrane protein [Candidatus Thiomargarita nelsonii]
MQDSVIIQSLLSGGAQVFSVIVCAKAGHICKVRMSTKRVALNFWLVNNNFFSFVVIIYK